MGEDLSKLRHSLARVKPWIAVASVAALALLGYFVMQGVEYWQASTDAASSRQEIRDLEIKMQAVPGEVKTVADQLKAQQERLDDLEALFAVSTTDELMGIISATSRESALELKSISSHSTRPEGLGNREYNVQPVSITLEGPVDNFSRFLSLLQQRVPVVAATDLRIGNLGSSPTAKMRLFFYLSPHAIEKADDKTTG